MRTNNEVREHLIVEGFIKGYTHGVAHGERKFSSSSTPRSTPIENSVVNEHGDMEEMLHDAFGIPSHDHKFNLPSGSWGMVLQSIGSKWRNWKSKLKRHPPTRVDVFNKCCTNSNGNPSSSEVSIAMFVRQFYNSCKRKHRKRGFNFLCFGPSTWRGFV
ncbi:hypothetical protein M9H77_18928 [Catharanthus roseus]|uniref:Uncharacterized protein n=1 Tax=Catharanthus roseus TaxID=4058 RepID=A0ACC0B8U3_CATRO|nr:hypothetical protein M9H77_18928 [Catharanthus roseus]